MLVSLVCLLVVPAFVALAFLVPSAIDLVRRDERVPVWWGVPLLCWFPLVPLAALTLLLQHPGREQATAASGMWATVCLAAAGAFVAASMALALPRGLRPEGPTERRVRTTLGAVAVLGVPSVAVPMAVPFWDAAIGLLWFVPAAWGGLFWVLLLNRRGPPRLEIGRRMGATWLVAAAGLFAVAVVHGLRLFYFDGDLEPLALLFGGAALFGAAVLAGGLRALSGPLDRRTLGVAAVSTLTLAVPEYFWWTWDPLPPGSTVATWTDLTGEPSRARLYPLSRTACQHRLDDDTWHGACDTFWRDYPSIVAAPDTPMSRIPGGSELLVDRGMAWWSVPQRQTGPWDARFEADGSVTVQGVRHTDPARARDAILARGWDSLRVLETPTLTVQQGLSLCASTLGGSCELVIPARPDPSDGGTGALLRALLDAQGPDAHALDGLIDTDTSPATHPVGVP